MTTLLLLLSLAAAEPLDPDAVVRDAVERLEQVGLRLPTAELELVRGPQDGWRLELWTSRGQVRAVELGELPPDRGEAAERVARAAARLAGPFDPADWNPTALSAAQPSPDFEMYGRVLLESTLGLVGAGALGSGFAVAGVIGALVVRAPTEAENGVVGTLVFVGGILGAATGVTIGGELTRGRGDFGWTLLGSITGAAVALPVFGLAYAIEVNDSGNPIDLYLGGTALAGGLAVMGSILFLERLAPEPTPETSPESAQLVPFIGPNSSGGLIVGVGGRF